MSIYKMLVDGRLAKGDSTSRRLADLLFLACVTASLPLYSLFDLGFYSDDWAFLGTLINSKYTGLTGLTYNFFLIDTFLLRPIQTVQLATLYWLFGTNPLGYHLVNLGFLTLGTILFHLTLRKLQLPRLLTISVPLIYALLPHYSTARLWMACSSTNISTTFFFLNFYANLRYASRAKEKHAGRWLVISWLSLVISLLAYEVVLPLFLLNFVATWWWSRAQPNSAQADNSSKVKQLLVGNAILFGACVAFKAAVSLRTGGFNGHYVSLILSMYTSAIYNDFITYGVKLPKILWVISQNYVTARLAALALLVMAGIFGYLVRLREDTYPIKSWISVILVGIIVYLLGYATFLSTAQIQITPTGLSNRITTAAALGVAACYFGAIMLVCSFLKPYWLRKTVLALAIAALCGINFVINGAISTFYSASYIAQLNILRSLSEDIPALKAGDTIILDGVCSYKGPAPVFECYWDLAGALQARTHIPGVRADVRTRKLNYGKDGITTSIYEETKTYPYGDNLIVYNYRTRKHFILPNFQAAELYFKTSQAADLSACPEGSEGYGAQIF